MLFFTQWKYNRQNKKAIRLFQRGLFVHRYNGKLITFDPLVVYKTLRAVGYENVQKAMEKALSDDDTDSLDKFFKVMKDAFGVDPVDKDGKGMTVREMCDMLVAYFDWLGTVKKNISPTQESPQSGGSPSSTDTETYDEVVSDETDTNTQNSQSDSSKTSSEQAPHQVSEPSLEQEAPSTD